MDRLHYVEGDTDSMYLAIAGDPADGIHQGFKHIIKDKEFFEANFYKWFPDPSKGIEDEKKLLGLSIEKEGSDMLAVGPKCYYMNAWSGKKKRMDDIIKMKGVMKRLNMNIGRQNYANAIEHNISTNGTNMMLRMSRSSFKMTKQKVNKVAITPTHNKMRVLADNSCAPFIEGLKAEDYLVDTKILKEFRQ
jgi:hypothetical protein